MRPVLQTKFGVPDGNCLMACVASILEIPLRECPDLEEERTKGNHWWTTLVDFCYSHDRVPVLLTPAVGVSEIKRPLGYSIASGMSPGGIMHACVALNGDVIHNPHPGWGINDLRIVDFIVFIPLLSSRVSIEPREVGDELLAKSEAVADAARRVKYASATV